MSEEKKGIDPNFLKLMQNLALNDELFEEYKALIADKSNVAKLREFLVREQISEEIIAIFERGNINDLRDYVKKSYSADSSLPFIIFVLQS